jgi:hypothetical protein
MARKSPVKTIAVRGLEWIPKELQSLHQWALVRVVEIDGKPKQTHYQISNPRLRASIDDPSTWGSLEEGLEVLDDPRCLFDALALFLTETEAHAFIDLKDALRAAGISKPGSRRQREKTAKEAASIVRGCRTQVRCPVESKTKWWMW